EALERLGAEVRVARADVTDLVAMQTAVDAAVARFGPIRGVIHSAGVPGGGVIQRRSHEAAAAVLAPKVTGTLVLDTIFRHRDLDFFVLCSSLSSVLGGFGQADYSAANAFLDAFAHHRSARSRGLSAAINWDAWREVGMAVDAAHKRATGEARAANPASATSPYRELAHPLFDRFMRDETGAESYVTRLDGPRSWVVEEHRVQGRPTLPGTAYLELARAAFGLHMSSVQPVELRDVVFLAPLSVAAGGEPEVRTVIRRVSTGQDREFTILSRPDPKRDHWQEHARGRITLLPEAPVIQHDIERLIRETSGVFNPNEQAAPAKQRPMEFGPRWQNLVQARFGRNHGLAFIQLPEAFKDDLNTFALHPAILDSATGFVAVRTPAHYLPFSYRRVRILRPIGACVYSYAGFEQSTIGGRERLQINLTIMDTDGVVQIEIEDYVLVRVAP
ncbi:MAG TPA: SDR family NAD(P)-dependent oxidoreductase, partial [Pseudomonadota bacterium]|nr:SDR family NAD(P)-dependent oxidoreductase [Pseudomonadota bacterium]